MILLLDVPAQLALVLSLAAAAAAREPSRADAIAALTFSPPAATIGGEAPAGPYRFVEGMWLRALKEDLPRDAAAGGYVQSIFRTSGGRFYVPRQSERRRILEARHDVVLAARAARALAQCNARILRAGLRRAPTADELWIAHLFGPEATAVLIARATEHPGERAAKQVPELVDAAQAVLGARASSLTLAELYTQLARPLERALAESRSLPGEREPTVADMLQQGPAWAALRPNAVLWQTEISTADVGGPSQ